MKSIFKKLLKIVIYIHVFLALGLVFTYCSLRKFASDSYAQAKKDRPYDVIIVPGVPYEKLATTSVMKMRILWAKHLYDSGYTKNIIFSGSSVYSHFTEGTAMKVIADSLGIPPQHTFAETKAEHSTENVYYSWKMAKAMGFRKIALATDPFQAGLLRSFTKKYCPGVVPVPLVFGVIDIDKQPLPLIDTTSCYNKDFVSITKRESFWKRFQGTRGRRVKEEVKAERKNKKNGVTD